MQSKSLFSDDPSVNARTASYSPAIQGLWIRLVPGLALSKDSISFLSALVDTILLSIMSKAILYASSGSSFVTSSHVRSAVNVLLPRQASCLPSPQEEQGEVFTEESLDDPTSNDIMNDFEIIGGSDKDKSSPPPTNSSQPRSPAHQHAFVVMTVDLIMDHLANRTPAPDRSAATSLALVLEQIISDLLLGVGRVSSIDGNDEVDVCHVDAVARNELDLDWAVDTLLERSSSDEPAPPSTSTTSTTIANEPDPIILDPSTTSTFVPTSLLDSDSQSSSSSLHATIDKQLDMITLHTPSSDPAVPEEKGSIADTLTSDPLLPEEKEKEKEQDQPHSSGTHTENQDWRRLVNTEAIAATLQSACKLLGEVEESTSSLEALGSSWISCSYPFSVDNQLIIVLTTLSCLTLASVFCN
eukprot:TRINITY_DN2401_c0_g1_i3.p1 TRINITY_DN2401_c0_g1~~TRINITY_DN2401_c0_g1_i3.p1  ORF type:complete len:413 (-),score=85.57 TRINITY_DN2401_c0_g1_i3:99-1337(-)